MARHLLYVLPYMNEGGTERQAISLMQHFRNSDRVSLLAPTGRGSYLLDDLLNIRPIAYRSFTRLDANLGQGLREFRAGIRALHAAHPIDLVHVHAAHELMLLVRLFLPQVPIAFTVHGYHGSQSEISYRLSCWFINRFAKSAIAVCEAEKAILLRLGIQPQKLQVIYNGVPDPKVDTVRSQELVSRFGLDPATQIIIGTAARLVEAKGQRYLLAAFAQVARDRPQLRLVLAGSGELEGELRAFTLDAGIGDRVVFTGYLENLADLMVLFDIFALPSLQEACSLACAEAMALGKPVVGSSVGGIPEQVANGENGFIVPPQDDETLAARLGELADNAALRSRFGQESRDRYVRLFMPEQMLALTAAAYEQCLT